MVSVPVLSEQITEVQPSVSTEGRLRTMAFFRAILLVPSARQVVMTAGRPGEKQEVAVTVTTFTAVCTVCGVSQSSARASLHRNVKTEDLMWQSGVQHCLLFNNRLMMFICCDSGRNVCR